MTDLAQIMDKTSLSYGDILIENGDGVLVRGGSAEVIQSIKQTLGVYFGEWFMDNTIGIDYFGQILVKNPDIANINAMLLSAILSVPGILQILSYSFVPDYNTRKLTVSFTARSTSGIITYPG